MLTGSRLRGSVPLKTASGNSLGSFPSQAEHGQEHVKNQLIEKLIEENRSLLSATEAFRERNHLERTRIRRNAALVMSKLVQDNTLYRKENEALNSRLVSFDQQNSKVTEQLSNLLKERRQIAQDKRSLQRYIETLREHKCDLEYQSKHLGAAFLTLRDAVSGFVSNPVSLEAQTDDVSWESRKDSAAFQSAVIETVQITTRLRATLEAIDQRLVGLRLLDASATLFRNHGKQTGPLELMGERLVPEKEMIQLKKERQLWQKRYMKCQEEIVRCKAELDQLSKTVEQKEVLLKKAIAQKGVQKTVETLRASLRAHNMSLREEIQRLTGTLAESQRQLGLLRKNHRIDKAKSVVSSLPKEKTDAPFTPLLSRAASQFLGTAATSTSQRGSPTFRHEPSRKEEKALSTARTMLPPTKTPRTTTELSYAPEKPRESDLVSVKSRTLRSPSRTLSPLMSGRIKISSVTEAPPDPGKVLPGAEPARNDPPVLLVPQRREIGTTVGNSGYLSPLAREVSALQRIRESEGITIPTPGTMTQTTPLNPSGNVPEPLSFEASSPKKGPALSIPTTPKFSSAPRSPTKETTGAGSFFVAPSSPPRQPLIVAPTEDFVRQVSERAEQEEIAIEKKATAMSFLGPSPIERKRSEGRKIGRRAKLEIATAVPSVASSIAEGLPAIEKQRTGLGIGIRGRRSRDLEIDKQKMRSFFASESGHGASPIVSPTDVSPRSRSEVLDQSLSHSPDPPLAPKSPISHLGGCSIPLGASPSGVNPLPSLSDIPLQIHSLLELSSSGDAQYSRNSSRSEVLSRQLRSGDLSSVLDLLDNVTSSRRATSLAWSVN